MAENAALRVRGRARHASARPSRAGRSSRGIFVRVLLAVVRAPVAQRGLSLLVFAGLFAWASLRVRAEVEAAPTGWLDEQALAGAVPPEGMSALAAHDLARLPFPGGRMNLHDDAAVPALARAYEALPWVAAVRAIEVDFPPRLALSVEVREPCAGLAHRGALYLIDRDARVLPANRYEPADPMARGLPVLEGAPLEARPLAPGERLGEPAVLHGLAVARALAEPTFAALFVERVRIQVANVDGRLDPRQAEIVVEAGRTRIEWGRSPLTARLHVPTTTKLERLSLLVRADLAQVQSVNLERDQLEWVPVAGPAK